MVLSGWEPDLQGRLEPDLRSFECVRSGVHFILTTSGHRGFIVPEQAQWRRFQGRRTAETIRHTSTGKMSDRFPKGPTISLTDNRAGRLGFLYDLWGEYGLGTTDHKKWFMLWNPKTGDSTMINGIKRGNFRLHPMGSRRLSEGCITVVDPSDFDRLSRYLRSHAPDLPVPGATLKAYGTVEVR